MHLVLSNKDEQSYGFKPLERYEMHIYGAPDPMQDLIKIYSNQYLAIGGRVYRITNSVDLTALYDVIITELQVEMIDSYYYHLKNVR